MLIAGFDCAVQNMGVCYIEYDDKWRDKTKGFINELHNLYNNIDNDDDFLSSAFDIVKKIDEMMKNIIIIRYFNVFDLIPGGIAKKTPMMERTRRLKYMLKLLDNDLKTPDVVLIEYQMKQNDISRCISHQIAYHYTSYDEKINIKLQSKTTKGKKQKKTHNLKNFITYAIEEYPLSNITNNKNDIIVETVGTTLKNAYCFTNEGEYSNFILRYSNYVANKKHTDWNFKHFIKVNDNDKSCLLKNISNKTNDISDAFMMIFGWLKKHDML